MIRKILKTLFIFFLVLSVYIMRDDIFAKINSLIYKDDFNINIADIQILKKEDTINEIPNVIKTPGVLKIINTVNSVDSTLTVSNIIALTNQNRIAEGLAPLTKNPKLDLSAEKKVDDMIALQYFEHVSPSGVSVSQLGDSVGYEYIIIGENLAMGNFRNDKALLDAWMASPGHRENILKNNYTEIGVSAKKGTFDGRDVWFAVQHFGTPKSLCPSIDSILQATIESLQIKATKTQKELDYKLKSINSGAVVGGQTTSEQIVDYNLLVNEYNKLINKIKSNISTYNSQVNQFNSCVESKQS